MTQGGYLFHVQFQRGFDILAFDVILILLIELKIMTINLISSEENLFNVNP